MNVASRLVGLAAVLLPASAATAQLFSYPNFASTTGLTLNGSAVQSGTNLRLTNNVGSTVGSAWFTTPVKVTEGFETEFTFLTSVGVEGLAFVVHGSPAGALALGGNLWGLGYGFGNNSAPIARSIAVEIDAVQQGFLNDTSANEVSLHTVGALGNSENEGVSIGRATPAADLSNNQVHTLRVRYVPGVIEVFVDGAATPLVSAPFSFENGGTQLSGGSTGGLGLPTSDAWVGFTSATPTASSQFAEIRSWSWVSYSLPDACYQGNVRIGSGGPFDVMRIDGTNGGFFRTATRAFADPFTLSFSPPPGETTAPFLLLATLGIADAATVTPTPWGQACFPLLFPIDLGGLVAPVSVPVPPGIFLPAEMTFQALMATDSANPNLIELTNAIGLRFALAPSPSMTTVTPNSAVPGNTITINGSAFSPFAAVTVGGTPVTVLTVTSTQITFAMPAGAACDAPLRVTNPDGAFAQRVFNPTPVITSQVNTTGSSAGGTSYVAIGTGFAAGTTVTIGGVAANVTSASATVVVAITPPSTPGPKPIVITTPGGCTVTSTFTYL